MTLYLTLKKKYHKHNVYEKNNIINIESGPKFVQFKIRLFLKIHVGIFSFNDGEIFLHLPNDESSNYDHYLRIINQVLFDRGVKAFYEDIVGIIPAIFFQKSKSDGTLLIQVFRLNYGKFLPNYTSPASNLEEEDISAISAFIANSDNYKPENLGTFTWTPSTKILSELYKGKLSNVGPCETPDSLFAMITSEICRFCNHVQSMKNMGIYYLTEDNMKNHMKKSDNTTNSIENANKKRIREFCEQNVSTFSPISLQADDFPDVEDETGSLWKRTLSWE
jgi:hypothetical protein